MAVETPTINKIIKINEADLLRTKIHKFDMYMCLDSQRLYYDSTDADTGRIVYNYIGVKTINDLLYHITPEYGKNYYCWEDNSLWLWMNKWITVWTESTYPSAYQYTDWNGVDGNLVSVYRNDEPLLPADDNGLLHDGSVIVRDRLRIIKGRLYIDDGTDNLVISSYFGGGIRFLPNGLMDQDGELFISDENDSFLRSQFTVKNNEMFVNYAEKPSTDPANGTSLEKPSHNYKVYHEGNLDASLIQPLTGEAVYNALIADKATLPDPFDFNVSQLSGHSIDDFSLVGHTHTASSITDFNSQAQAQAQIVFKQNMNNAIGEGMTITAATDQTPYKFSADNFRITLTGGATGNSLVRHLTDTSINVVVDPDEHVHQNYIDTMNDLQDQINALSVMDPDDYYTKIETDALIGAITPTDVPTVGKALKVNAQGILPVGVISAQKFDVSKHIELTGDITGSVDTDFQNNTITLNTSAANILSTTPVSGKALAVNAQGNLPGNATSSSQLNHTITVSLTNEVLGSATLDTALNTFSINCTLNPGSNILQSSDLNILVPEMENVGTAGNPSYKIKTANIPDVLLEATIKPKGTFDPNNGVPTNSPVEGHMWVAEDEGTIDNVLIKEGDQYVYLNGEWNVFRGKNNVTSVNGQYGNITLTNTDVNAISDTYINYTVGNEVPANKIPITDTAGHLPGVKIDALTNEFDLITDSTGDIQIDTVASTNISTDGTEDLDVKLEITPTGYQNILDTIGHVYQRNGVDLPHRPKLNFSGDFSVVDNGTVQTLSLNGGLSTFKFIFIENKNNITQDNIDDINDLYDNRATSPILVIVGNVYSTSDKSNNDVELYLLDGNIDNRSTSGSVVVSSCNQHKTSKGIDLDGSEFTTTYYTTMTLTFDSTDGSTINTIVIDDNQLDSTDSYLSTRVRSVGETSTAFSPTYDYQAASKKYVDDAISNNSYKTTIGDGSASTFTITHNLGTADIIVQFRDLITGQQVYIDNSIMNNNSIQVITNNTILSTNQVRVIITKC